MNQFNSEREHLREVGISEGRLSIVDRFNRKQDCRVRLQATPHPGTSDLLEGTLRGSPVSMFVYLLINSIKAFAGRFVGGVSGVLI
jgi:hypothetical protein